jgi:hypothetical protein
MELLSQIPVPKADGNWAAFYAVLALMITNLGRWLSEIIKDRREARKERQEAESKLEREKLQDKLEHHRQITTDRIASSNEAAVVVLNKIEGKLQEAHILSRVRHEHVAGSLTEAHIKLGIIDSKIGHAHNGIHDPQRPNGVFEAKAKSFP